MRALLTPVLCAIFAAAVVVRSFKPYVARAGSAAEEPMVRRLFAGGSWIRTVGSAPDRHGFGNH